MNLYRRARNILWRLSIKGLPRGPHVTRYSMYRQLTLVGDSLQNKSGRILSISHSTNLVELLGLQPIELVEANYPDADMASLAFDDNAFDFVLSDQVLEHVEANPRAAIDECLRVLKPGGYAVHTTCFINPVHDVPKDFWRFTPDALKFLHRHFGEILECKGWGNFEVWSFVKDGLRFTGVPEVRWHPLNRVAVKNNPLWPIVTWIVARK